MNLLFAILQSLRAHAFRFALTSLGMVWGVAMLTYNSASADGYDAHFARQIDEIGQRIVFLFPGTVTKERVGHRGARVVELELKDVDRLAALEAVDRAGPNAWIGARVLRARGRTKLVFVHGVNADTPHIRNFTLASGRFPSAEEVRNASNVLFLGAKVAARLFRGVAAVGQTVHVDGIPFRVVGVARPKGDQLLYVGPADDEIALIPATTAERWFTRSDTIGEVVFAPRTRAESWEALRQARGLLGLHHHFRADDDTAMGAFNVQEVMQIVEGLLLGLRVFLSAASLVTLLAGAIGVTNIMLVMVSERTREIGLRKAIGASNGAIFAEILAETLAVTLVAGLVGALLGGLGVAASAAAIGQGTSMQAPPVLRLGTAAFIVLTLVAAGVAAGIFPALRATRVDPAVALRAL